MRHHEQQSLLWHPVMRPGIRGWGRWGGRSCVATRKFLETLLNVFGDYGAADHLEELWPSEGQTFLVTIRLKSTPCPKFSVCVLGDQQHYDEARVMDIPHMDIEALKKLSKNKKLGSWSRSMMSFWPQNLWSSKSHKSWAHAWMRMAHSLSCWSTMRTWWPKWIKWSPR